MLKHKGFTLIELMTVVVIIGILAAIAYPSYSRYVQKGYRTEAKSALLDLAARQERHYAQNYRYADLSVLGVSDKTEQGKYLLSIPKSSKTEFELQASPTFADAECGIFVLKSNGEKSMKSTNGVTGTVADCW